MLGSAGAIRVRTDEGGHFRGIARPTHVVRRSPRSPARGSRAPACRWPRWSGTCSRHPGPVGRHEGGCWSMTAMIAVAVVGPSGIGYTSGMAPTDSALSGHHADIVARRAVSSGSNRRCPGRHRRCRPRRPVIPPPTPRRCRPARRRRPRGAPVFRAWRRAWPQVRSPVVETVAAAPSLPSMVTVVVSADPRAAPCASWITTLKLLSPLKATPSSVTLRVFGAASPALHVTVPAA